MVQDPPRDKTATGDDAVQAARELIAATSEMYFAETGEQSVAAAQKAFVGAQALTSAAQALKDKTPAASTKEGVVASNKAALLAVVSMLDKGKGNRADEAVKKGLEEQSEKVTATMNDVISSLRRIPGLESLQLEAKAATDLDSLAEQELLKCAQIIADAAKTLLQAKPRKVQRMAGSIDQDDINDAILEAATAIASATGALVQSAAVAQQERMKNIKETPAAARYQADATWANGLISAAQNVAHSVQTLVKNANDSVQGKVAEEALVASARSVAQATAHLVAASRAKSDPDSKAQMGLKSAAKTVSSATAQLVAAANAAATFRQEEPPMPKIDFASAGGKAKELEQQMNVLRLEKELEKARQVLGQLRKARYVKK